MFNIVSNESPHIYLYDKSGRSFLFLVDTGASTSFINSSVVEKGNWKEENCIDISGIEGKKIKTLGDTKLKLFYRKRRFTINFQVLESSGLRVDGILGTDFLTSYAAQINYSNWVLTLYKKEEIKIPLLRLNVINDVELEPYTRNYVQFLTSHTCDVYIPQQHVNDNIFVYGNVQRPTNYVLTLVIENNGDKKYRLDNFMPDIDILENFTVYTADEANNKCSNVFNTVVKNCRVDEIKSEKVMNQIDTKGLGDGTVNKIKQLVNKFVDVFSVEGEPLGTVKGHEQKIFLKPNTVPRYIKQYRLPQAQREVIAAKVREMVQQGLAEPCISAWNSPVLLVPKKGASTLKDYRLVIDYRRLNDVVEDDKFPIPNIDEILDDVGQAKVFSTLDLDQGYYQMRLEKESRPCTAFTTKDGHFQLVRMPMGLKTSPSCFSRMMLMVLGDLIGKCAYVYLDDIVVYGKDEREHAQNLERVLSRLRSVGLKLKPKKCQFFRTSVKYLGHEISDEGIRPDPEKFKTIREWSVPKTVKQVQSFLGFANYYRRFIENFSKIAKPLYESTKKDIKFRWTDACQEAFELLKHKVTNPPVLSPPDFSKEFILQTDASNFALGAVLMNYDRRPIAFISTTLKSYQLNYEVTDKELLAIVWACKQLEHYLYGQKFVIETDHKALEQLYKMSTPGSRHIRFRLKLEEFKYRVEYIKGKTNVVADALSRLNDPKDSDAIACNVVTRAQSRREKENAMKDQNKEKEKDKIVEASQELMKPVIIKLLRSKEMTLLKFYEKEQQVKDFGTNHQKVDDIYYFPQDKTIFVNKHNLLRDMNTTGGSETKNGFLTLCQQHAITDVAITEDEISSVCAYGSNKFNVRDIFNYLHANYVKFSVVPRVKQVRDKIEQNNIIKSAHSLPTGGHLGIDKTVRTLQLRYFWPTLARDVKSYISNCEICQTRKYAIQNKIPMRLTDTASKSFEKTFLDLVGPFPESNSGNKYILTIQDDLSKFLQVFPLEDKKSDTVAKVLVEEFFLKFKFPKIIASDCGLEFKNNLLKSVCGLLKIDMVFSAPYHHETIGALENSHKTLRNYLRSFADEDKFNWDLWLPYYAYCYNSKIHSSTGFAPFELVFGENNDLPDDIRLGEKIWNNTDEYLSELQYRLKISLEEARRSQIESKRLRVEKYNKNNKSKIPLLEIGSKILVKNESNDKMQPLWLGPFDVVSLDENNVSYMVKDKIRISHLSNVKLFKGPPQLENM